MIRRDYDGPAGREGPQEKYVDVDQASQQQGRLSKLSLSVWFFVGLIMGVPLIFLLVGIADQTDIVGPVMFFYSSITFLILGLLTTIFIKNNRAFSAWLYGLASLVLSVPALLIILIGVGGGPAAAIIGAVVGIIAAPYQAGSVLPALVGRKIVVIIKRLTHGEKEKIFPLSEIIIAVIFIFIFFSYIVSYVVPYIEARETRRIMDRDETVALIEGCEIVTIDKRKGKVSVQYRVGTTNAIYYVVGDDSDPLYRPAFADPDYFDDYVGALEKVKERCEMQFASSVDSWITMEEAEDLIRSCEVKTLKYDNPNVNHPATSTSILLSVSDNGLTKELTLIFSGIEDFSRLSEPQIRNITPQLDLKQVDAFLSVVEESEARCGFTPEKTERLLKRLR